MESSSFTDSKHGIWLAQLQLEYDEILYNHGVELKPPVFEIAGGTKQLGSWRADTRSIAISEDLILSYPWYVVLQVLRHEMAHQYCDEVAGNVDSVHGETFQLACEILGVLPHYRNPAVLTAEMVAAIRPCDGKTGKAARVFAKVEKLLALSDSPHIHEAELALAKARQLMEKYQLENLAHRAVSDYHLLVIDTGKKQIARYRRYICSILNDFFSVRVVLSSVYSPESGTYFKTIELLGTRENTQVAEYCYHFLENQLDVLWRDYRKRTKTSGRRNKNSFYLGVVLGFYKKLEAQNGNMQPSGIKKEYGALLVLEEERLDRFTQMIFPRLKKSTSRRSTVNSRCYNEGIEAGRAMNFHDGLNNDSTSGGRLLTR